MRKLGLFLVATTMVAQANIINVNKANYSVTSVDPAARTFGVDLVQNRAAKTRSKVHLKKDAKCWWVMKDSANGPKALTQAEFMTQIHKGTRVRVTGGRDWNGDINASEVWGQN